MNINEILNNLPNAKPHQNSDRTIKQTLLLFCLEKQIIQKDITLLEEHPIKEIVDILEYKKIWLDCWLKKRNAIFKDYYLLNIMNFDMNTTKELYKNIKQNTPLTDSTWKISIYYHCTRFEGYAFHEFTAFDKESVPFKKWLKKEYSSIKLDDNAKAQSLKEIASLLEITI